MTRVELQRLLEAKIGSRNVYFQPPESKKMSYPAVVYELDSISTNHANNFPYLLFPRYKLMLIDEDPDSELLEPLLRIPTCRLERHYNADGLNHYVMYIYTK